MAKPSERLIARLIKEGYIEPGARTRGTGNGRAALSPGIWSAQTGITRTSARSSP